MLAARAAILRQSRLPQPYATSQPLSIEDVLLDEPGEGEVLVEIKAAGLCHSDLSVINGDRVRPLPMALGHEGAGVVSRVGPAVHGLEEGDHVVLVFVPSCGSCAMCLSGRPALCEPAAAANGAGSLLRGGRRIRFRSSGCDVHHHLGVSCFAERAVVSARSVVKIDRTTPFEHAAMFGCAVLTGVGAVVNTARVAAGETVAVVGLGGVGLNALLAARLVGAGEIVAIDLRPEKLEFARELGATHAFAADDPKCIDAVRQVTGGGVDHAFEMAGSVPALDLSYRITKRGGTTTTAGLSHPDRTLALQHLSLVAEERTLKGSYIGSCVPQRDVPRYLGLFHAGKLPIDRLMSEKVKLDGLNDAFDALSTGSTVRQVLIP